MRATACRADADKTDLAIAWHPSTQYDIDDTIVERLHGRHHVVNAECTDIRKSRVGRVFASVFGYSLEIDPARYRGTVLRKSERNGPHDAVLLDGPLTQTEQGYVYQRLIDYETSLGLAEWRTIVVAGRIAAVYANYRPAENRFQPLASHSELVSVDEAFTQHEQDLIGRFSRAMRLDLGALDILRDRRDGRIYICDCNNTPTGPSQKTEHYGPTARRR